MMTATDLVSLVANRCRHNGVLASRTGYRVDEQQDPGHTAEVYCVCNGGEWV